MRSCGAIILAAFLAVPLFADVVPTPADYQPPFNADADVLKGLVITIDPGHGGSSFSPGYSGSAVGVNSRAVEGDLNMRVAGILYHHLKDSGATVYITRRDDRKVAQGASIRAQELGSRTRLAAVTRSHLFISLHHNSTGRDTADGVVILIDPKDKQGNPQPLETALADVLRDEVSKTVHQSKEFAHYQIEHPLVSSTDIPSAVIEFGFLSNPDFDAWVTRPGSHKEEAIGAWRGIVRMWQEHGEELEALRQKLFPETAADKAAAPATPSNPAFTYGAPSPNIWPMDRPVANAAEGRFVLNTVRNALLTDRTTVWFRPELDTSSPDWLMTVSTNLPQLAETARTELEKAAARRVVLDATTLPSKRVAENPFAVVDIPMALTWSKPEEASSVETQILYGEPLYLLDVNDDEDCFLVQGIDGYAGWVRSDAVRRVDRAAFTELINGRRARATRSIMLSTFRIPPAGFTAADPSTRTLSNLVVSRNAKQSTEVEPGALRFPEDPAPGRIAAETALREYLYTPYVFGGRSPIGIDCSGLVGAAWTSAGVQLPRDANQQTLVGELVATSWYTDALQPGDILFFADDSGRTYHTAISLGGSRYIHASPPEVQINSLDPSDELFSAHWQSEFFVARRPSR